LLKARKLWGLVGGEKVKPKANHLACEIKDIKFLNLLVQGLSNNQLMNVKKNNYQGDLGGSSKVAC